MNSLILPPYLNEGDKVAIVSPSSKIDKSFLKGAKKRLESWGLKVITGKYAGASSGRYAGTIKQRLKDFQESMDDPEIKAILCSRVDMELYISLRNSTLLFFVNIPNG